MILFRNLFRQYVPPLLLTGVVAGLILASPSLSTAASSGIEPGATEAVRGTISDLIKVLDDETLKQPEQAEERRHEIEKVIKHRVDYQEMARRALGAPWPTLSHRDQREFVDLFVQLLRDTFAGRISERSDEQVAFLGERRKGVFAEVKAQMKGTKDRHPDRLSIDSPCTGMEGLRCRHRWSQYRQQLPRSIHEYHS